MKVLITGATGFVGTFLSEYLLDKGHQVIALGRRPKHSLAPSDFFSYLSVDPALPGDWQDQIPTVDAIINLAGKNIFHYWTETSKQVMHASRVETTRNLVAAISENQKPILISASAIGYYGDRAEESLTEISDPGDDFLANLSLDWEKEAQKAADKGTRVALMRFSIVLGRQGGALAKMLPAFQFFAGGPLGSGQQWFSWIHIKDLVAAVDMILENQDMAGPFNFCAPEPVRNQDYAAALGKALGRPSFLRVPSFAIKTLMGELGGVMLGSQRCFPEKLQAFNFKFQFPDIETALADLV
jgi:uncharacterized protein (TIGR01777 family)